jgi:hypothetical protein
MIPAGTVPVSVSALAAEMAMGTLTRSVAVGTPKKFSPAMTTGTGAEFSPWLGVMLSTDGGGTGVYVAVPVGVGVSVVGEGGCVDVEVGLGMSVEVGVVVGVDVGEVVGVGVGVIVGVDVEVGVGVDVGVGEGEDGLAVGVGATAAA